jgi:hypothetical protein
VFADAVLVVDAGEARADVVLGQIVLVEIEALDPVVRARCETSDRAE